jgi:hypothetical protein
MLNPTPELGKALWGDGTFWQKLNNPTYLFFNFAPRGWLYQNALSHVKTMQKGIQCYDVPNQLIFPGPMNDLGKHQASLNHWNPGSFLEFLYLANLPKATQRTAYNQTLVNEAQVACALERYRLAHGAYPETLDSLASQYIEQLPHDIIGGQPLHYRRIDDLSSQGSGAASGKYLLYSVGWNETDDGGVSGTDSDLTKADWVWKE